MQPLWVDRPHAGHAAWYELFPRSFGGLKGAIEHLRYVADLGFDVVYLPPIHPIGTTHRKGRDNSLVAGPDDPGSPWAIGGPEGGHDAVHPDLGTIDDFDAFVDAAEDLGLEVALDYALQCSPDHPWVRDHPEWFQRRPDGSIRYAENPPEEVPGHPPDRVLAGRRGRPRRAVGGVPRRPRALDRPRRPHVPRRQPAHQAARVLGVGDPRRARVATPR